MESRWLLIVRRGGEFDEKVVLISFFPRLRFRLNSDGTKTRPRLNIIGTSDALIEDSDNDEVRIILASSVAPLTIKEVDGSPNVTDVEVIRVSNGTLTNDGGGQVTIDTTGGGGGSGSGTLPIQEKRADSTNTNSLAASLGTAPTNGNLMILISVHEDGGNISSITQTNVTWSKLAESTASTSPHVEIWKGVVAASAGTSITVAYSSTSFSAWVASEWTGYSGTLDQSASRNSTTDNTARHYIPFITPTSASALVVAGCSTANNTNGFTDVAGPLIAFISALGGSGNTIAACYAFPGTNPVGGMVTTGASASAAAVIASLT